MQCITEYRLLEILSRDKVSEQGAAEYHCSAICKLRVVKVVLLVMLIKTNQFSGTDVCQPRRQRQTLKLRGHQDPCMRCKSHIRLPVLHTNK